MKYSGNGEEWRGGLNSSGFTVAVSINPDFPDNTYGGVYCGDVFPEEYLRRCTSGRCNPENATGEARKEALRVDFDSQIKLEFHGASITSDAGLIAFRERDEAMGRTAMADDLFRDPRRGMNTQHELTAMLRQAVYSRLAGYEDTNDAERQRGQRRRVARGTGDGGGA